MAILVTGGAGYIGSHTVRLLLARGRPVVVLDSMESGHAAAVGDAPLVVGNIADHRLVACRRPTVIAYPKSPTSAIDSAAHDTSL